MIFHQSLLRELRGSAGLVFASLMTIVVTTTLIRSLGRTASGQIDGELLAPLLLLSAINTLPLVLTLTALVSVVMVLSRQWKDSEMVVWMASGQSLLQVFQPVLRFLLPLVAITGLVSLVVSPWAREQSELIRQRYDARQDSQRLTPGQFRESASGKRVFFMEQTSDTAQLGQVFVLDREPEGRETVILARQGRFLTADDGQPWVEIQDGTRSDLSALSRKSVSAGGELQVRTMDFDRYRIAVESSPLVPAIDPSVRAQSLVTLVGLWGRQQMGELAYRLGLPTLCLLLGLLAIPLSTTSPRMGRSLQLVAALLITITANNFLSVSQTWIAQGRLDFGLGLGLLPSLLAGLLVTMTWWQLGLRRTPWQSLRLLLSRATDRA